MLKKEIDLFGNVIENDPILRDKFIEPPFTIIDTKTGSWRKRKKLWMQLGIKSEVGRPGMKTCNPKVQGTFAGKKMNLTAVSIFDPALCEVLYYWFCPPGGTILDPFAGGSVRGVVANKLGYRYTGIDIRQEQIDSNREQALDILELNNQPNWYVGDSNKLLAEWLSNAQNNEAQISAPHTLEKYDFIFSCPPYADLEVYSELEDDISNMPYDKFLKLYEEIIDKSCRLLKPGGYACFVVGEVRDKNGHYLGFVPDTIKAFEKAGVKYYNEAILATMLGTAMMRASNSMKNKKLVKVHQNVLVFIKP